jgi:hypothetical protein
MLKHQNIFPAHSFYLKTHTKYARRDRLAPLSTTTSITTTTTTTTTTIMNYKTLLQYHTNP